MNTKRERTGWLLGNKAQCEPLAFTGKAYRLVLLGAPGVGKGTQAELLTERLGACQLSTGDIFRSAKTLPASQRTPALEQALEFMRRGELVPDQTVVNVVREHRGCLHCPSGFLLDGFPRTVAQAEALTDILRDEHLALDAVICYELPMEVIVARLGGRRVCAICKTVYHLVNRPPRMDGVCDLCRGPLVRREDDRPEAIRVRMETYRTSTEPLIDYYQRQNLLVSVDAHGEPEETFERTMGVLGALQHH